MTKTETDICKFDLKEIGHYRLDGKCLGKGTFARVELATHKLLEVQVAIKIVNTEDLQREYVRKNFEREGKVLSLLNHPNIVKLYETMKTCSHYCLVMEYISGESLMNFIRSNPGKMLPEPTARWITQQLVEAIKHVHQKRILHRDLKPENILLHRDRKHLKLIDFGLSNFYDPSVPFKTHCGSLEYAAPELFNPKGAYGPEIDMWSFDCKAVSAREMLSNEQKNQLIQEVRRYSCLYDVTSRGYKDRAVCDSAWDDVARTLGIEVEPCKRTWRSLRDEFTKRRKRISQKRTRAVYELNKKWPFYGQMMFIQRFINKKPPQNTRKCKKTKTKIKQDEDDADYNLPEDLVAENEANKSGLSINSGTRNSSTVSTFPYSDHKGEGSLFESSFSPLSDYYSIDEDALFGRIVTATLRKLSPKTNAEAKARIQHMLYEVQFGSFPSSQNNYNQNSSFQRSPLPTITSVFSQANSQVIEKSTDASNISAD